MKHIKIFEDFNVAKAVIGQSFVTSGMVATDYNNEKWKVIKVVPMKDFSTIKKYDESGAMAEAMENPDDYEIEDDTYLIAVKNADETAVFTYGPDGACVWSNDVKK